jgi:MoxR-like ATPase
MNFTELKNTLPVLLKNNVVPFIWGAQGCGKTQGIKQIAKDMDGGFVHLHLATQEVGDLVGLLVHSSDGTVKHARPEWFPTEGQGIVFLDELNRSTPDVLQALFSFITDGTIHRHKLPAGWKVVAAGNYQTNMFNVTDTSDSAWMSRFCHLDFQPSKEEFVLFAESKEAYSVADFIRSHGELLEVSHKERLNTTLITPDRRAWLDMIAKLETEESLENVRYEVYSGIVGSTAAASFISHKKKFHDKLSGRDILNRFDKVKDKVLEASNPLSTRFDLLNGASEEILLSLSGITLSAKQMNNFQQFLLTIPLEMGLKIVKRLHEIPWKQKNEILNHVDFAKKFKKLKLS